MCGRFTLFADDAELVKLFDIDVVEGEHAPSYNQAPSQLVRAVRDNSKDDRELDLMSWGLVPFWAKDSFKPLINARAETVTEKPSFRTAVSRRRCLIPANGYYEWQEGPDGKKQPWLLSLATKDGDPAPPGTEPIVAMAGIFEWPERAEDGEVPAGPPTCAIITREATDTLGEIHPRMPLFIPRSQWDQWLDPSFQDSADLQALVDSIPPAPMAPRMVSPAVGNVRNNTWALIAPYNPEKDTLPGL